MEHAGSVNVGSFSETPQKGEEHWFGASNHATRAYREIVVVLVLIFNVCVQAHKNNIDWWKNCWKNLAEVYKRDYEAWMSSKWFKEKNEMQNSEKHLEELLIKRAGMQEGRQKQQGRKGRGEKVE